MVSREPLGVHRWPDTLSEGVRIGSKCGYTGVSSYSRVVFQMAQNGQNGQIDRFWDTMEMVEICHISPI